MFLHLGNDISVKSGSIIAIQDYKSLLKAKNETLLRRIEDEARKDALISDELREVGSQKAKEEGVKSVVITQNAIYLSSISSQTLLKRHQHKEYLIQKEEIDDLQL